MCQLDLHGLRRRRGSGKFKSKHSNLEGEVVVRRILGEHGAEERAVAQSGRGLVGQSVAGGADRTLLAFALLEID